MKHLLLPVFLGLSLAASGCHEKKEPQAGTPAPKQKSIYGESLDKARGVSKDLTARDKEVEDQLKDEE